MINYGLLIIYAFCLIKFGINLVEHGKPKTGNESFFISTFSTLISLLLIWWALGWRFI